MTAPRKHILHNILPVLGLKCLKVRICDRDILPWHCSFAGWILTFKMLPTGFEQIMLRLSDMTENTLYLHSTDFSLSLWTYPGYKRKQKQRIFKSACWALRPLLWTTYDRDKSEILSQQFWHEYMKYSIAFCCCRSKHRLRIIDFDKNYKVLPVP